jgi:hypothetical protein
VVGVIQREPRRLPRLGCRRLRGRCRRVAWLEESVSAIATYLVAALVGYAFVGLIALAVHAIRTTEPTKEES